MCGLLGVSSSGYYDWLDRPPSTRARDNDRLVEKIIRFHTASRKTYGSPRIFQDLRAEGETCGIHRVARLMNRHNIASKMARRFVITTDSRQTEAPAPDLLQRDFRSPVPNRRWVSDTTFIPTRQGWLYFAVILDLFSRCVVGWSMSASNNAQLVVDALKMALKRRKPDTPVIVHSDQGSTYASNAYQKELTDHRLTCSMSRKGECHDNAVSESFFGTLKNELVVDCDYRTREEAQQSLFESTEIFYNRKRRHSFVDYLSPIDFEAIYHQQEIEKEKRQREKDQAAAVITCHGHRLLSLYRDSRIF
jgi:transposase InsO family protein